MQIYEKLYGEYINEKYGDFVLTAEQKHELAYAIQKRLTKEEIAFLLRTNKGEKTPAFSGEQMREIVTAIQRNIPLNVLREHYPLKFSKEKDSDRLRFIREGIQYHYTAEQLDIIKNMDITKELYSSEIYDMYNYIMSRFPVEKVLHDIKDKSGDNIRRILKEIKENQTPKSEYSTKIVQNSDEDIKNVMKKYKDVPQHRRQEIKAALMSGIKSETIDDYYRDYPDAPLQFRISNKFTVVNEYYPMIPKKARDVLLSNAYNEYQARAVIDICNLPYTDEELKIIVNPKYNHNQMSIIAEGFLKGITIEQSRIYLDENIPELTIFMLQGCIINKVPKQIVDLILDNRFDEYQKTQLLDGYYSRMSKEEMSVYAHPEINADAMEIAIAAFGFNRPEYANLVCQSSFTERQLGAIKAIMLNAEYSRTKDFIKPEVDENIMFDVADIVSIDTYDENMQDKMIHYIMTGCTKEQSELYVNAINKGVSHKQIEFIRKKGLTDEQQKFLLDNLATSKKKENTYSQITNEIR